MEDEHVYLMRDAKQALLCVRDLESEYTNLIAGLEVMAVFNENEHTDWYLAVNTHGLAPTEALRVVGFLSERGWKSEECRERLSADPRLLFRSVGGLDQIMNDLEARGESVRTQWKKIQLN